MRIVTHPLLAVSLCLLLTPGKTATAEESQGNGLLCEWRENDIFQDDYAHSSNCQSEPPQGGNDWQVISYGQWTNSHSVWVYTTIAAEPGDQHSHIAP
jgi:hypothetical protein